MVAHLYEEVGARVPELLRGMFAFALWDARAGTLLLARDRFGEKPLYYGERAGRVRVRLRARRAARRRADAGATLSLPALDAYLALQYVPQPRHDLRGACKKLPAGHTLERPLRRAAGACVATTGPSFAPHAGRHLASEEAARARARHGRGGGAASRLMSDVPLGAFLSGGVDSSIVVACMARATGAPGQDVLGRLLRGRPRGQRAAVRAPGRRALPHRAPRADRRARTWSGLLPSIVRHHGEPFADTSAVPTRYLCEMTRRHVTVALSGDAGDEAFGGYRRYVWAHVADLLARPARGRSRAAVAARAAAPSRAAGALGARVRRAPRATDEATRYLRFVCHFSAGEKARHLHARAARAVRPRRHGRGVRGAARPPAPATDTVSRLQDLDVETYLPDDILAKVDIASMTHGLEARAPLVDHHVVELGAALPGRLKLRRRQGQAHPQAGVRRPGPRRDRRTAQEGIRAADRALAARGGCTASRASCCCPTAARERGLFAPAAVEALLDRHRAGEDHGERIWNLMVLETWFRELVDGRASFVREVAAREAAIGRAEPISASL